MLTLRRSCDQNSEIEKSMRLHYVKKKKLKLHSRGSWNVKMLFFQRFRLVLMGECVFCFVSVAYSWTKMADRSFIETGLFGHTSGGAKHWWVDDIQSSPNIKRGHFFMGNHNKLCSSFQIHSRMAVCLWILTLHLLDPNCSGSSSQ